MGVTRFFVCEYYCLLRQHSDIDTYQHFEQDGSSGNVSDLHSGDAQFESRPRHRLF
jgi:hypothetical protein